MKASDLRDKKVEELREELNDLRREQFNLRIQHSVGQSSRPARMQQVRRDIARVKTVINEKLATGEPA